MDGAFVLEGNTSGRETCSMVLLWVGRQETGVFLPCFEAGQSRTFLSDLATEDTEITENFALRHYSQV